MAQLVHEFVHSIVRRNGERIALVADDKAVTCQELWERAGRLASALSGIGVSAGERVVVLLTNQIEWVEADLAISQLGAIRARLNARDSHREFESVLLDVTPRAVITEPQFADTMRAIIAGRGDLQTEVLVTGEAGSYEQAIEASETYQPQRFADTSPYIIFHTSGTTGTYKGAVYQHRNWLNIFRNIIVTTMTDVSTESAILHVGPMSHQSGLLVFPGLACGARSVLMNGFTPDKFFQAVEKHKITHTILAPTIVNMLVNHPTVGDYDVSSLQRILYSGSPIAPSVLEKAIEVFGPIFLQGYGSTEGGTIYNTILYPEDHVYALEHDRDLLRSGGRPTPFFDVKLADEHGNEVPQGEIGEIWVRGDAVSVEYWNRPEATEQTYVDGWFRMGDLATRSADDVITIVDRKNDLIISGGLNVYPREVEDVIAAHPGVQEVAVIGVPDAKWGEAVKACVSLRDGHQLDLASLQEFCIDAGLASYKKPLTLDILSDLPRTAADKVSRRHLREPYWAGQERSVS